jgi:hypothetical protein
VLALLGQGAGNEKGLENPTLAFPAGIMSGHVSEVAIIAYSLSYSTFPEHPYLRQ